MPAPCWAPRTCTTAPRPHRPPRGAPPPGCFCTCAFGRSELSRGCPPPPDPREASWEGRRCVGARGSFRGVVGLFQDALSEFNFSAVSLNISFRTLSP